MFEKCTFRARRVISLAREQMERMKSDFVGTEHLLLALMEKKVSDEALGTVFKHWRIESSRVREEISAVSMQQGTRSIKPGNPPFTFHAIKAMKLADEESIRMGSAVIDSQHLLLGLLKEEEGVAAQVFANLGIKYGDVSSILPAAPVPKMTFWKRFFMKLQ